jgi:hypothetical protein
MGTVTRIDTARERRLAAVAAASPMHPALRYTADGDDTVAHRRTPMGRTVCDLDGPLRLAPGLLPLCGTCYAGRRAG